MVVMATNAHYFLQIHHVAKDSGLSAVNVANDILVKHTNKITLEKRPMPQDQALEIAGESDYLIYSIVEEWVDPLGLNCGKYYHDYASVQVQLYDIKEKKLVNNTRLSAETVPQKLLYPCKAW